MVPKKMVWDHPVSSVLRYYPDEWDVYKEVKLLGGFDLDWTLIRPLKGFFSKGSDDIALLPRRKEYLHFLVKQGLIIVIFTNQRCRNEKEVLDRKQRLDYFLRLMEIPLIILASLKEDEYRKPHIGMLKLLPFPLSPELKGFYCGDAGGRPQDFADSDLQFARNLGLTYYTPELLFPSTEIINLDNKGKRMIVMMGMPGSGKSTFVKEKLIPRGYAYLSQDQLGSKERVMKELKSLLAQGKSVVIDGTNPSREKRRYWIEPTMRAGYQVDIIYMVRNGQGFNNLRDHPVPAIVYNVYFKQLELPQPDEINGAIYEVD